MRRDPLARAMRPDKSTLAAVALTLGLYRAGRAVEAIPVWRMIATPADELRARAEALAATTGSRAAGRRAAVDGRRRVAAGRDAALLRARAGGPTQRTRLLAALRRGEPAVIGRIEDDRVVLDLRTVEPEADGALGAAITQALDRRA